MGAGLDAERGDQVVEVLSGSEELANAPADASTCSSSPAQIRDTSDLQSPELVEMSLHCPKRDLDLTIRLTGTWPISFHPMRHQQEVTDELEQFVTSQILTLVSRSSAPARCRSSSRIP